MLSVLISSLEFAVPILIVIFIGLFGTGILIELGLMQKLARFASPLFRFTNLPDTCASSFMVSMGSTVAGNTMVVKFRDTGCINNKETILCAAMNTTPAYIRGILTYQIPIVLPALGPVVGGFYVMVFILTGVVKVTTIVVLSKLLLKKNTCKFEETIDDTKTTLKEAAKKSLTKNKKLFTRIAVIYLAMTTLVFYLQDRGTFEVFSIIPLAETFGIPPESIVPLTSFVASPVLGISLLGPMLNNKVILPQEAMIVLMLGSMFMLPVFSIRSLLPRYISIFGARTGIGIVTFSTTINVLVRFVVLLVLLSMAN